MRLLITGSRGWTDRAAIERVIDAAIAKACAAGQTLVVVHGAARGADQLAGHIAMLRRYTDRQPVTEERHPVTDADWKRLGKRAGMVRNAEMVALGADLGAAFIRQGSAGATHCAGLMEAAGIPTVRVTWDQRAVTP